MRAKIEKLDKVKQLTNGEGRKKKYRSVDLEARSMLALKKWS